MYCASVEINTSVVAYSHVCDMMLWHIDKLCNERRVIQKPIVSMAMTDKF